MLTEFGVDRKKYNTLVHAIVRTQKNHRALETVFPDTMVLKK